MENVLSLNTWRRFVSEGVLDSSRLHKRIIESWYRCKESYVDPYLEKGTQILKGELLQHQKEKNSFIMSELTPYLHELSLSAEELGMIALYIDAEGYVLSISGNKEVIHDARRINFMEGVKWTEGEVGTNAIGTALYAKEAIMVNGVEHYSVSSHRWSCAAAPLFLDDGTLMGVIDISSPLERSHPFMLGMVVSSAYKIERAVRRRTHQAETELIQQSMDLIEEQKDILICSINKTVVGASKSIRNRISNWFDLHLKEIMQYDYYIQMEVPLFSKKDGRLIGTCLYLVNNKDSFSTGTSKLTMPFNFHGENGISESFQHIVNEVKQIATAEVSVSIVGETGSGKEVIARSIHENSLRKKQPFVAVNCGAIPQELMASELFGYVEGAFTGARRQGYKGKFEQAHKGTLFLDEIGELPKSMQVALLRVLQERIVTPIGSNKEIPVDFRIITATHQDLRQLVRKGEFREDLYYRLYVYPIHVPPLRERNEDIPYLVRYFYKKNHWKVKLSSEFFQQLTTYDWPGNIRELFNFLERIHVWCGEEEPDIQFVQSIMKSFYSEESATNNSVPSFSLSMRETVQKEMMMETLRKTNGNVSLAAKMLGVPRSTFYKRMRKYHL